MFVSIQQLAVHRGVMDILSRTAPSIWISGEIYACTIWGHVNQAMYLKKEGSQREPGKNEPVTDLTKCRSLNHKSSWELLYPPNVMRMEWYGWVDYAFFECSWQILHPHGSLFHFLEVSLTVDFRIICEFPRDIKVTSSAGLEDWTISWKIRLSAYTNHYGYTLSSWLEARCWKAWEGRVRLCLKSYGVPIGIWLSTVRTRCWARWAIGMTQQAFLMCLCSIIHYLSV